MNPFSSAHFHLNEINSWSDFHRMMEGLELSESNPQTHKEIAQIVNKAFLQLEDNLEISETDTKFYEKLFKWVEQGEQGSDKYQALAAIRKLQGPNLDTLPVEMQFEIMKRLSVKDKGSLASITKSFYEISENFNGKLLPFARCIQIAKSLDKQLQQHGNFGLSQKISPSEEAYEEVFFEYEYWNKTLLTAVDWQNQGLNIDNFITNTTGRCFNELLIALSELNILPDGKILSREESPLRQLEMPTAIISNSVIMESGIDVESVLERAKRSLVGSAMLANVPARIIKKNPDDPPHPSDICITLFCLNVKKIGLQDLEEGFSHRLKLEPDLHLNPSIWHIVPLHRLLGRTPGDFISISNTDNTEDSIPDMLLHIPHNVNFENDLRKKIKELPALYILSKDQLELPPEEVEALRNDFINEVLELMESSWKARMKIFEQSYG